MNDDNRFDVRMRQMVKNYQDHAPQNDVSINDNNNKNRLIFVKVIGVVIII